MNFLKNRNYLSLAAFLLVSFMLVFASCEKETSTTDDTSQIEALESNEFEFDENTVTFTLPDEYNNMSNEEIKAFFENVSEEKLLELSIPVNIEARGPCVWSNWQYIGTTCKSNHNCFPNTREIKVYKRKCVRSWNFDYWEYTNGAWRDCCG